MTGLIEPSSQSFKLDCCYTHSAEREMEAQRGEATCPKTHSPDGWELCPCEDPAQDLEESLGVPSGFGAAQGAVAYVVDWGGGGVGRKGAIVMELSLYCLHTGNTIFPVDRGEGVGGERQEWRTRVPVSRASHCWGTGAGAGLYQQTVMNGLGPSLGVSKGKLRPSSCVWVRNHCHPGKARTAGCPALRAGQEIHRASGS